MLRGYNPIDDDLITKKRNRLVVVNAALEIAKASAGALEGSTVASVLKHTSEHIGDLADSIEKAIQIK